MATKSNNTQKSKRKAPAKQEVEKSPIRREIWAAVCFFLAFFTLLSLLNINAPVLNIIATSIKWCFGWGFYIVPLAFFCCSLLLLFHHGRPVTFRIICVLLIVIDIAAILHMFLCRQEYTWQAQFWNMFGAMGIDGVNGLSGGAFGGFIAFVLTSLISSIGCGFVLFVTLFFLLLGAVNITVSALYHYIKDKRDNRVEYIPEPEPTVEERLDRVVSKIPSRDRKKTPIDIPLDSTSKEDPAKETADTKKKSGFFKTNSEIKTPADVLTEEKKAAVKETSKSQDTPMSVYKGSTPRSSIDIPLEKDMPGSTPRSEVSPSQDSVTKKTATKIPSPKIPSETKEPTEIIEDLPPIEEKKIDKAPIVVPSIDTSLSDEEISSYKYPPLSLLEKGSGTFGGPSMELKDREQQLIDTIRSFGLDVTLVDSIQGPAVTRFEIQMDTGIKLSRLTSLSDDIAMRLGAVNVRIAPVPGKGSIVGIEIPNSSVSTVKLRDVLESNEFQNHKSNIAFALGKDITGKSIVADIAKLPHMLIAGTTGSGKSVCTNSLILSLLYKSSPEDVRLILIDPKMVELGIYNGIPHLLIPVVTDPKKAAGALQWAVTEMMRRYKLFSQNNVREMNAYNALIAKNPELGEKLPQIVIIIDELADLMMAAAKEVEEAICRIAQMARAAGMHLIIATQRPSADVITGLMKANIPSRIAFAVASSLESRIILDMQGAEKLVGRGDMLFLPLGTSKPVRIQGTFVSDEEREKVIEFLKSNTESNYSDEIVAEIEMKAQSKDTSTVSTSDDGTAPADDGDELLPDAIDIVVEAGQASTSFLQRRLKLGYSRAARIVDQLEERGIVGPFEGSKPRALLISKDTWNEMKLQGITNVRALSVSTEAVSSTDQLNADDNYTIKDFND